MTILEQLKNIGAGDKVIYYTGPTPRGIMTGHPLARIMDEARKQAALGKATLFQRKISTHEPTPSEPTRFEYIAIGRSTRNEL